MHAMRCRGFAACTLSILFLDVCSYEKIYHLHFVDRFASDPNRLFATERVLAGDMAGQGR